MLQLLLTNQARAFSIVSVSKLHSLNAALVHGSKRFLQAVALSATMLITGGASANTPDVEHTLAGNKILSKDRIERLLGKDEAANLLDKPYRGFYGIKGEVGDSIIRFGNKVKAQDSDPDGRLAPLATGIASLLELPAVSTGSRIKPKATAYIIFYDHDLAGIDRDQVMHLPTSAEGKPNTLALLVIDHRGSSSARPRSNDERRTAQLVANQNGTMSYWFELTI